MPVWTGQSDWRADPWPHWLLVLTHSQGVRLDDLYNHLSAETIVFHFRGPDWWSLTQNNYLLTVPEALIYGSTSLNLPRIQGSRRWSSFLLFFISMARIDGVERSEYLRTVPVAFNLWVNITQPAKNPRIQMMSEVFLIGLKASPCMQTCSLTLQIKTVRRLPHQTLRRPVIDVLLTACSRDQAGDRISRVHSTSRLSFKTTNLASSSNLYLPWPQTESYWVTSACTCK